MKMLQQLFDSEEKESARLVAELAAHTATWSTVKAQYDEIDLQCVELARILNEQGGALCAPTIIGDLFRNIHATFRE